MITCIADNVVSPLGMSTEQNYLAVKAGQSVLQCYERHWGLPDAFTASLFTDEQNKALAIEGLTRFESLTVQSARLALEKVDIDASSSRVVFILGTTKANIEALQKGDEPSDDIIPSRAAEHIAQYLGISTTPIVACNACISGVAAIILALRLLEAGCYDYAIVCGADVQDKFTVSGFQSLKAVSEDACRPFDIERLGLNLGEAAATLVLARQMPNTVEEPYITIDKCAMRNDAFHISSPSKNGEGARLALQVIDDSNAGTAFAFINAHGTATMFNDQMESVAIERSGINDIPVNALKGYFGHTLGAAGILETVISMAALRDGTILATRGYNEHGVSGHIHVTSNNEHTDKRSFVKMISGFGGCNAVITATLRQEKCEMLTAQQLKRLQRTHCVKITNSSVRIDGQPLQLQCQGREMLVEVYKTFIGAYPKFYKMDGLSRLGFVATELLLQTERGGKPSDESIPRDDRAVILFNTTSSIVADRSYWATVCAPNDIPSPSHFVYTLPNIVTGEIAIRNLYRGETSFYILPERDDAIMTKIIEASMSGDTARSAIAGWIDYPNDRDFEAELWIVEN